MAVDRLAVYPVLGAIVLALGVVAATYFAPPYAISVDAALQLDSVQQVRVSGWLHLDIESPTRVLLCDDDTCMTLVFAPGHEYTAVQGQHVIAFGRLENKIMHVRTILNKCE